MMEAKKDKEGLQQALMQLQMIEQQLKEIEEQIVHVEEKKQEIQNMQAGLSELKKSKPGNAFAPLGLGMYSKSKILDTSNVLVNVGSDVFLEKDVTEMGKILKNQVDQFEDLSKSLTQNYQILGVQAQALQAKLQEAMGN